MGDKTEDGSPAIFDQDGSTLVRPRSFYCSAASDWSPKLVCPPKGNTEGYNRHFASVIQNGSFHRERGTAGEPRMPFLSLRILARYSTPLHQGSTQESPTINGNHSPPGSPSAIDLLNPDRNFRDESPFHSFPSFTACSLPVYTGMKTGASHRTRRVLSSRLWRTVRMAELGS